MSDSENAEQVARETRARFRPTGKGKKRAEEALLRHAELGDTDVPFVPRNGFETVIGERVRGIYVPLTAEVRYVFHSDDEKLYKTTFDTIYGALDQQEETKRAKVRAVNLWDEKRIGKPYPPRRMSLASYLYAMNPEINYNLQPQNVEISVVPIDNAGGTFDQDAIKRWGRKIARYVKKETLPNGEKMDKAARKRIEEKFGLGFVLLRWTTWNAALEMLATQERCVFVVPFGDQDGLDYVVRDFYRKGPFSDAGRVRIRSPDGRDMMALCSEDHIKAMSLGKRKHERRNVQHMQLLRAYGMAGDASLGGSNCTQGFQRWQTGASVSLPSVADVATPVMRKLHRWINNVDQTQLAQGRERRRWKKKEKKEFIKRGIIPEGWEIVMKRGAEDEHNKVRVFDEVGRYVPDDSMPYRDNEGRFVDPDIDTKMCPPDRTGRLRKPTAGGKCRVVPLKQLDPTKKSTIDLVVRSYDDEEQIADTIEALQHAKDEGKMNNKPRTGASTTLSLQPLPAILKLLEHAKYAFAVLANDKMWNAVEKYRDRIARDSSAQEHYWFRGDKLSIRRIFDYLVAIYLSAEKIKDDSKEDLSENKGFDAVYNLIKRACADPRKTLADGVDPETANSDVIRSNAAAALRSIVNMYIPHEDDADDGDDDDSGDDDDDDGDDDDDDGVKVVEVVAAKTQEAHEAAAKAEKASAKAKKAAKKNDPKKATVHAKKAKKALRKAKKAADEAIEIASTSEMAEDLEELLSEANDTVSLAEELVEEATTVVREAQNDEDSVDGDTSADVPATEDSDDSDSDDSADEDTSGDNESEDEDTDDDEDDDDDAYDVANAGGVVGDDDDDD